MSSRYVTLKPRVEEVDDDYVPPLNSGKYLRDVPYSQEKKPYKKKYGGSSNYVEVNTTDENLNFHIGGSSFKMSYDEAADLTQNEFLKSSIFKKVSQSLTSGARANFALAVTVVGAAVSVSSFAKDWYNHTPGTWGNIIGSTIENVVKWIKNITVAAVSKVQNFLGVQKTSVASVSGSGNYKRVVGPDGKIYNIPVSAAQKNVTTKKVPGFKQVTQTLFDNFRRIFSTPLTSEAQKQAEAAGKIAKKSDVNIPTPSWLIV